MKKRIGLVGARGYVGRELVALVEGHSSLELALAVSQRDGMSSADVAAVKLDAYVLALPNGASEPYVDAIQASTPEAVIVDLSADHRFDASWVYGHPERNRARLRDARAIANPGCYATAMQLALLPLVPALEGPANAFGISGYSGAGTTPSPNNDPDVLRDNIKPYSLVGHVHEREVAAQLGCRLFFVPHVAPFFRGISVTVSVALAAPFSRDALVERFRATFRDEPLVQIQDDIPLVRDIAGRHDVIIGGFSLSDDGRHAVVVATIDNLLGGAATQAVRSLNLALGLRENDAIPGAAAAPLP